MSSERHRRAKELFLAASELAPEERAAFLAAECKGDGATLAEVLEMFAAVDADPAFLDRSPALDQLGRAASGRATPSEDARYEPGTVLMARYRIVDRIGRGGMGDVYRAEDLTLDQPVAIKFLPAHIAERAEGVERFRQEVRLARRVTHPNVARIFDIGYVDGRHFLTMEYVDGDDLADTIARIGRFPPEKAIAIGRQMCAALSAAHDEGVLHRDFKPANVLLDREGKVKITDFGLAALSEDDSERGLIMGTPPYMAPEQITGRGVSVRSDIYSLGLVLYEVFTGQRPFEGRTLEDYRRLHESEPPRSPSDVIPDIDLDVERIVLSCLEKDPARRPDSVRAVGRALRGDVDAYDSLLAEAVAAGETPAPEVVAAAGSSEGLRPAVALTLFAALLATLLALVLLESRRNLVEHMGEILPPEALAHRARVFADELFEADAPFDTARGFVASGRTYRFLERHVDTADKWRRLDTGPAAVRFWYRESPYALDDEARGVTQRRPPLLWPGMLNMELHPDGRLISAAMNRWLDSKRSGTEVEWAPLFAAAEIPTPASDGAGGRPRPASPLRRSPVFCDHQYAWTGHFPERPEIPMRIEAASYQGRPVWFRVDVDTGSPSSPPRPGRPQGDLPLMLLLIAVCPLAWSNVRRQRADHRRAARLAWFVFTVGALTWFPMGDHSPDLLVETVSFGINISIALMYAMCSWVAYLALEPYVRKRYPRLLISWTRLLSGKLRDPWVGRDLLIGLVAGAAMRALIAASFFAVDVDGASLPFEHRNTVLLGDTWEVAGGFVRMGVIATSSAAAFLSIFVFLRILLRNAWAAAAAWLVIVPPMTLGSDVPLWFVILPVYAITFLVLMLRLGLVATLGMGWMFLALRVPLTADVSAWHFEQTLVGVGPAVAVGAFAFHTALGGRRLFQDV